MDMLVQTDINTIDSPEQYVIHWSTLTEFTLIVII